MPGFNLYTSNRVEHLIPILGEVICSPRRSIFEQEIIVVQNKGMEQWLSLKLATHLKIVAFCDFPFPHSFFNNIIQKVLPNTDETSPFDPEFLLWKIYKLLPSLSTKDSFAEIKSYLKDDDPLRLFQLSAKIADIFDQYTMYRPEMIMEWEKAGDENWQSILWRALATTFPAHRVHLKNLLEEKILNHQIDPFKLPQRVSFFGISSLPPCLTDLLRILSQVSDIHYFLLNPCAEYWDDIISEKELSSILRKKKRKFKRDFSSENLHYETGNHLLASFGIHGRDFLARLHELECNENSFPISVEPNSLLTSIQSDILTLAVQPTEKKVIPKDFSIQVHSCHSSLREIEVLHDSILNFFNTIPHLTPSDIIVMAPDIEEYVPAIKMVFGSSDRYHLPYSLADRSLKDNSSIAEGFLEILEVITSRFTSSSVINLLEIEELRAKFDLSEDDIILLKNWFKKVGIRWGLNGESKKKYSVPQTIENSWKSGLDQLILGFALPEKDTLLFNNMAGSNLIEGNNAEVIGKFLNVFTILSELNQITENCYTLQKWSEILLKSLNELFLPNIDKQQELTNVTNTINTLSSSQIYSDFDEQVPFSIVKAYLQEHLSDTKVSLGFLNGGITFCSMLPMRGIPFKVVALLGLSEDSFPRKGHNVSWDMISAFPKKGDRSLEKEDRYIFLETLLSAREVLYFSYTGQNIQKSITQHPSVCVEELLDYIDNCYSFNEIDHSSKAVSEGPLSIRNQISFQHRLHAFNPEYFKQNSSLFSYSTENLAGAQRLVEKKVEPSPFFSEQLTPPPPELRTLTIEDLIRFFSNPSKYLLQKRLGVYFTTSEDVLETEEAFDVTGLERYDISERTLDYLLNQQSSEKELFDYFKATNLLPHGQVGGFLFSQLHNEISSFAQKIKPYLSNQVFDSIAVNLESESYNLSGQIKSLSKNQILSFRYTNLKPKDYLSTWIKHLCANCLETSSYPNNSLLITKDSTVEFGPISNARELLDELMELYIQGLTSPLPFFPQCSWEYAQSLLIKQDSEVESFQKAYKTFYNSNKFTINKEAEDQYVQCCFSEIRPLNEVFKTMAIKVFGPLISNMLSSSD